MRTVPDPSVARLPIYHRALVALAGRAQLEVSSTDLAAAVGVNPATIRRDLSHLGTLGVRGRGYDVEVLLATVKRALAVDLDWPVVIVGAGNLGRALACSQGFTSGGFQVKGVVDVSPSVVGTAVGACIVAHLEELGSLVARERVAIGVVATPAGSAQEVTDRLVASGVRSLLNFAPATLVVPDGVRLRHVDLSAELAVLAFHGRRAREPGAPPWPGTADVPVPAHGPSHPDARRG